MIVAVLLIVTTAFGAVAARAPEQSPARTWLLAHRPVAVQFAATFRF